MQEEVKHYKVKSLSTQLRPNSVYYVKATSQSAVNTYITDQNGFPFPLLDLTGGGNVGVIQSVTGTGVTGTFSNPIINISTFKSSDSGNLIEISSNDGKLFVKPITSPDGSIDIAITASALELQLGLSLQTQIQNALQPGDNISELINDVGYITLADLPFSAVSATAWTPNHTTATGNPYLAGTIVYYLGHIFQANFTNDSIIPAIGGNLYWTDLGLGYLIDQEQTDWLAVSGSEFIKNKPTNVSSFTNDAGYLIQDNVVEYANLAAFPITGVIGTIYIALDTGLFYSWNGTTYVPSSAPNTGITGVGLANYVGRWTSPTTMGTGVIRDDGSNVGINTSPNASYRLSVNGNANISNFLYANVIQLSNAIIYDGGGNLGSRTRGGRNVDYFASGNISSHGNITFSDGNRLTSGTETARFDTYDRRLGIRTTTPTEALDVDGNIRNRGFYYDETNSAGTAGKILSATSTGTQWINSPTIPTTPNLQQVTTEGSTTTNEITVTDGSNILSLHQDGTIGFQNAAGGYGNLRSDLLTNYVQWQLPDAWGTIALIGDIPTVGTWGALNYPTWTTGTPFVKMTAAGTFALDTTSYYPYPTGTTSQYIRGDGTLATFSSPLSAGQNITIVSNAIDVDIPPIAPTTSAILGTTGSAPQGIVVDSLGNVYTSNLGSTNVTKITPSGTSSTLGSTGSAPQGIVVDLSGNVYIANLLSNNVTKITPAGVSSTLGSTGNAPVGIAVDSSGNVYTANSGSNNVSKITPAGMSNILGSTGSNPIGIVVDSLGNVYTSNQGSNNVTKITFSGTSSTLGSTGSSPCGITIDSSGNIYTANLLSNNVTKITPSGTSSTLGTTGDEPIDITIDSLGNVYTVNRDSSTVTKITSSGTSSTLASTGFTPLGITIDSLGNIYTANNNSNNVTKITIDNKRILAVDNNLNIIRVDGALNTFPSITIPTLQQVVTAGNIITTSFTHSSVSYENTFNASSINIIDKSTPGLNSGVFYQVNGIYRIYAGSTQSLIFAPFDGLAPYSRTITIPNASGTIALLSDIPSGGVTSVTATSPITSSGGATPDISTSMATNKLIGRSTAGTGVMEEITVGTGLSLSGGTLTNTATYTSPLTTKGDIFVRSTIDTRLPVGTDGQILTANSGVAEGLSWQDNYADWTSVVKHIVKNNGLSGTITKGTAVYVTSSDGTNMLVGRASNTSEATSSKTMGLMQSDITTTGGTQTGFVITEGLLGGLNTASAAAGDPVWLGVNGALIYGLINKPYAPDHLVFIGIVTKVSAGNGEIFVKVQNGFELKELHDVQAQNPTLKDTLWYDNTVSPAQWKTASIATILGYTPVTDARTLTINGTAYDLTADRSWTITASGKSINTVSINTNAGSASSTDYVYLASGTINITLPTAVGNQNLYTIKNVGTGVITVDTTSSETIDGSLTAPIRVQYLSLTIISDGANWNII